MQAPVLLAGDLVGDLAGVVLAVGELLAADPGLDPLLVRNALLQSGVPIIDGACRAVRQHSPSLLLAYGPDAPLHLFTRWAYEEVTLFGHRFRRGDEVGLRLRPYVGPGAMGVQGTF